MTAAKLERLPIDILLIICSFLKPEDYVSLIQTCKCLHEISKFKVFWIHCGMKMLQRRRVHRLPLEELSVSELRFAIVRALKLDYKWGGENGNPGPLRCIELDTTKYNVPPMESQAVTWAWFLDDGEHIVCVVEDRLLQLWHLPSNKPLYIVHVGGRLYRASKYIDQKYFVLVASVHETSIEGKESTEKRAFKVWRYEWGSEQSAQNVLPFIDIPVPMEATFTFITQYLTGFVFIQDERTPSDAPYGEDVNIWVVNWWEPSTILQCYTPLSIFGPEHADQCRDDTFRMTRFTNRLVMHFETTRSIDAYFYDLDPLRDILKRHATKREDEAYRIMVNPVERITYKLASEINDGLPTDTPWATWGDSSLWDGKRVGLLSQNVKWGEEDWVAIITLSILNPNPAHVMDPALDGFDRIHHSHAEFTRPVVYIRPEEYTFSKTSDYHALVSQPAASKNAVWALARHDSDRQIQALVLAQFPSEYYNDDVSHMSDRNVAYDQCSPDTRPQLPKPETTHETVEDSGTSTPVKEKGTVVVIDVTEWLPIKEIAEDIDLDDVHGRVALGMKSGKVMILEFI